MEDRMKVLQIKLYQSGTKYLNYVLHGSFRITYIDISSFFFVHKFIYSSNRLFNYGFQFERLK